MKWIGRKEDGGWGACLVDLPVFRGGFVVWFLGEIFLQGHGLEDSVVPLEDRLELSVGALRVLRGQVEVDMLTGIGISSWVIESLWELKLLDHFSHQIY